MGSDNESEKSQKEKKKMLALAPIAKPLAGKKLCKKTFKLVRKASESKCLKRGVKEVVKSIRRGNKGTMSEEDIDRSPLWKYVTRLAKVAGGGNVCFTCNYCKITFKGSYSRVKAHLLKISGSGIRVCAKVTSENLSEMRRLVDETESMVEASLPQHVQLPTCTRVCSSSASYASASMGRIGCEAFQVQPKKRKVTGESAIEKAFNSEAWEEMDSLIARMFYSAGLPFHLARNPYYVAAITKATMDSRTLAGYIPPGYNMLRTTLLQKERANIENLHEPIRNTWKEKGVSIICDGWMDAQRRPIINFMAACESGSMFLKAVKNEGEYKDEHFIANLIKDTIYEVGPDNVVQVITDNAPVCRSAGMLIEAQFPHIFWTPSVVHSLDLVLRSLCIMKENEGELETFAEFGWIKEIISDVMMIKDFIMDHSTVLSIFSDLVKSKLLSTETLYGSSFVMLKRFKKMKQGLQSMVIGNCLSSYLEEDVRRATFVREKLLDDVWWDKIDYILSFTEPIYEMLRLVDTDMPCLHLVYDMWDSLIKKVKYAIYRHESKQEDENSTFYLAVHQILVDQWGISNTPLHCLAHSLNPKYYSAEWLKEYPDRVPPYKHQKISTGRLRCFERYFGNEDELRQEANTEFAKFAAGLREFANINSLNDRGCMEPVVWWMTYGSSAPLLQKLAMKLLGQPCSSSWCERNWSTYSFINSLKKNKIIPQGGEDLVFVHSNLRLLSRRTPQYKHGETKMWDVGGDAFDTMEGSGILEIANLSLDEPDLETIVSNDEKVYVNDDEVPREG